MIPLTVFWIQLTAIDSYLFVQQFPDRLRYRVVATDVECRTLMLADYHRREASGALDMSVGEIFSGCSSIRTDVLTVLCRQKPTLHVIAECGTIPFVLTDTTSSTVNASRGPRPSPPRRRGLSVLGASQ